MKKINSNTYITVIIPEQIMTIKKMAFMMLTAGLMLCNIKGVAQINPLQSMYFQNPYLYNPAMAGYNKGFNLNLVYRKQGNNFPGAPKTGAVAVDFQTTDRVGLGVNVYNAVAGLTTQTRAMATYAYHLPLSNDNQHLNFGLSLGVGNSKVNINDVIGDQGDTELGQYNELKPYIDGDFGIAYTSNGLQLSAVVPNLKSAVFKSTVQRFDPDRLLFIAVASYKIPLSNVEGDFSVEPLAAYRAIKDFKGLVDAGFKFDMKNYGIYMESIYHSNNILGLGFGLDRSAYVLSFNYNVETGQLGNRANSAFELGLKLRLFDK